MIQSKRFTLLVCCAALAGAAWGCSTNQSGIQDQVDAGAPGGAGGDFSSNGGASAGGGATGIGGEAGTGGASVSGGTIGTGGAQGPGGTPGAGGSTGGTAGPGGRPGTGGSQPQGGRLGTGGSQGLGGRSGSGGNPSTGGSAGGASGGTCSSTAPIGLELGMLIPDVQLQQCDGSSVSLHDLVCGKVLTQVYSYAGWCPGCTGFAGLGDDSFMTGNSLYDRYHAKGFEQVIILSATAQFGKAPTAADCAELQASFEGLVVFDASGKKTQDELGLKINGGTALVDGEGIWVVPPPVDPEQDAGLMAVFSELTNRFGFR